ncbi:VOC family protein [Polymorphospora lycopeni]|uniref:VOC family protein n=1 Tax=Polymorphospora lycopeni TaxID=3140240 RepID=A0ABV5CUH2_9ACTN
MKFSPVVVSLPIADRGVSYRFYRDGLGLEPFGEIAEDGFPEPLQFTLNEGLRIMLIPTGGFGWVIGDNQVAVPGQIECIVGVDLETRAEADNFVERAREAGARIVTAPQSQPWGYTGSFADPDGHLWMVTVPPS